MYLGERLNAWTHLVGSILAVAGAAALIAIAASRGDPGRITAFAVYGATLSVLFIISTLYHAMRGGAKRVLRKLDHVCIYLLIAGTYAPFALVTLNGAWGWTLFGIVFYLYDERYRHWHGIWHLFVMGGSTVHYTAILVFVA